MLGTKPHRVSGVRQELREGWDESVLGIAAHLALAPGAAPLLPIHNMEPTHCLQCQRVHITRSLPGACGGEEL